MSVPAMPTGRRRVLLWGLASLALVAVLGAALSWGASALERWGVLPKPQTPAWYDCDGAGQPFALHYLQGSDRLDLQWPDGARMQADSWPDRLAWRDAAALVPARQATLPQAFRYQSTQRLELLNASGQAISCTLRSAASGRG